MKFKFASVLVMAATLIAGGSSVATAQTASHPRIIDFRSGPAKQGLTIGRPAMVVKLKGTSPAFKRYVAAQVRLVRADRSCPTSARAITVYKYATNGYALGAVNDCGGYVALWGVRHGAWRQLIGTQDVFRCGQLHRDHVPVGLLNDGKCYIPGKAHLVTYRG